MGGIQKQIEFGRARCKEKSGEVQRGANVQTAVQEWRQSTASGREKKMRAGTLEWGSERGEARAQECVKNKKCSEMPR